MNWQDFAVGIALVLVLEGMLPFLSPTTLRRTYLQITRLNDGSIRAVGMISMAAGLLLLTLMK